MYSRETVATASIILDQGSSTGPETGRYFPSTHAPWIACKWPVRFCELHRPLATEHPQKFPGRRGGSVRGRCSGPFHGDLTSGRDPFAPGSPTSPPAPAGERQWFFSVAGDPLHPAAASEADEDSPAPGRSRERKSRRCPAPVPLLPRLFPGSPQTPCTLPRSRPGGFRRACGEQGRRGRRLGPRPQTPSSRRARRSSPRPAARLIHPPRPRARSLTALQPPKSPPETVIPTSPTPPPEPRNVPAKK